jgi:hypothetical protein
MKFFFYSKLVKRSLAPSFRITRQSASMASLYDSSFIISDREMYLAIIASNKKFFNLQNLVCTFLYWKVHSDLRIMPKLTMKLRITIQVCQSNFVNM